MVKLTKEEREKLLVDAGVIDGDALELAMRDLIIDGEVFYGQLLQRFRRRRVNNADKKSRYFVPTAAVGVFNNEVNLIINEDFFSGSCSCDEPDFVTQREDGQKIHNPICKKCSCLETPLTSNERKGILKHECQHIAHRHLTRRDAGDFHPVKANIAMDSCINEYNSLVPKDCVKVTDIPNATENQTWEVRYALLEKDMEENQCQTCGGTGQKQPDSGDQNQDGGGSGDEQQDGDQQGQGGGSGGEQQDEHGHGHGDGGEPCPDCGGTGQQGGGQGSKYGWVIDDHKFFGDADSDTNMEIVDAVVKEAIQRTAENVGIGNCPQEVQGILAEINGESKINWRKILKNWMQESFKKERYLSPFRESLSVPSVFPGGSYKKLPEFDVYVDASGSIGMDDFEMFMTEVLAINKTLKATINLHQWDTIVHKSEVIEKQVPNLERAACGGTDVACVKEHAFKNKNRNIIIMTDGYFASQDFKGFNLLWVYTPNSDTSHAGKKIVLED